MMGQPQSWSLAWALLATLTSGQHVLDKLSFGNSGTISPGGGHGVPGWHANSVNHDMQVLSDRVILTPPVPGNAKGALWSDTRADTNQWSAEVWFRASGQETGSGNLNVWYTNDRDQVGVNSVYNVEKFDGMVLTIDQYGGTGGKIRGFLNDGTQNFRTHSSLESLAFGHCDYSYRNRGEYSKLKISNANGLSISIDDRTCFSSDKISMPQGYFFGVSAATAESPDSFEINRFVVTTGGESLASNQANMGSMNSPNEQNNQNNRAGQNNQSPRSQKFDAFPGSPGFVGDRDAEAIKSQSEQFADLHNRIQNLQHNVADIFLEIKTLSDKMDAKQNEMLVNMQNLKGSKESGLPPDIVGKINRMSDKMESMERTLDAVKKETADRDYKQHLMQLHTMMDQVHGSHEALPDRILDIVIRHSPRMGFFLFIVVAVQAVLAGAYIMYKRRRNSLPKKFL